MMISCVERWKLKPWILAEVGKLSKVNSQVKYRRGLKMT